MCVLCQKDDSPVTYFSHKLAWCLGIHLHDGLLDFSVNEFLGDSITLGLFYIYFLVHFGLTETNMIRTKKLTNSRKT